MAAHYPLTETSRAIERYGEQFRGMGIVDGATPLLRLTYAGGSQEELKVVSIDGGRMVIEKP